MLTKTLWTFVYELFLKTFLKKNDKVISNIFDNFLYLYISKS